MKTFILCLLFTLLVTTPKPRPHQERVVVSQGPIDSLAETRRKLDSAIAKERLRNIQLRQQCLDKLYLTRANDSMEKDFYRLAGN